MSYRISLLIFLLAAIVIVGASVEGRPPDPSERSPRPGTPHKGNGLPLADDDLRSRFRSSTPTSFTLASFDFQLGGSALADAQGWVSVDASAQLDTFWHVADSTELDGGTYGQLRVARGARSMWCGTQADAHPELCTYATLPGVGNNWRQQLTSQVFERSGDVTLEYWVFADSEPSYDMTFVQFRDKDWSWAYAAIPDQWNGYDQTDSLRYDTIVIPDSSLTDSTQVRFAFFSDGAFSDQDGLWPSDGAIILDDLTVADGGGAINFQDFEGEVVGAHATNDGFWQAGQDSYGDFAALYPGYELVQEGPCVSNFTSVWGFLNGSTATYACGGHPEQTAIPFGSYVDGFSRYMDNEIWSPPIDYTRDIHGTTLPAAVTRTMLEFDVYRDLPLDNLVFYVFAVRGIVDGCASPWDDFRFVYYSVDGLARWFRHAEDVTALIAPGSTEIQVALGVVDMKAFWANIFGTGTCHSHAPLFDNVRVTREAGNGPLVVDMLPFQDRFPAFGVKFGPVPIGTEGGQPARIEVVSSHGIDEHIDGMPSSGPAVYLHVKELSPAKSGSAISQTTINWPVVSSGGGWTVLQCRDLARGRYDVDLADTLYTPADTICYYFSMRDTIGTTTYWSSFAGDNADESMVRAAPNEVTCLPANALSGTTDILYINAFAEGGAQPFFDDAFRQLGLTPDRLDFSDAADAVSDQIPDVVNQVAACYRKIIWNTAGRFFDPVVTSDHDLMLWFLDQHPQGGGVYLSGDGVASDWAQTAAGTGLSQYMDFTVLTDDHTSVGEPLSPFADGQPGSIFDHSGVLDRVVAHGGCPTPAQLDVLLPGPGANVGMAYSGNLAHGAVVTQAKLNALSNPSRFVLSGFSFHRIHDDVVQQPTDRVDHLRDILLFLGNAVPEPTGIGDTPTIANELAQNYPNPFNPTTTISYALASPGHARVAVYNAAGARVRTLVDGARPSGRFKAEWDGRSDAGDVVASGIYFYRLSAPGYSATRKMVFLK